MTPRNSQGTGVWLLSETTDSSLDRLVGVSLSLLLLFDDTGSISTMMSHPAILSASDRLSAGSEPVRRSEAAGEPGQGRLL